MRIDFDEIQTLKDMPNEIISYLEMCQREGTSLQRGMNFRLGANHSVILMSLRPNAPYEDSLEEDGTILIYEGHDAPRSSEIPDPKLADQPIRSPSGGLTQNGLFYEAAKEAKKGTKAPERVRVYEKLRQGIWSYNGVFHLVDAWRQDSNTRKVFKFKLMAVEGEENLSTSVGPGMIRRRVIPTRIKLEVWKRDGGRCVVCGATDELHFDHIVPYSKGGSSLLSENIQLLCARHNIEKQDKIL